MSTSGGPAGPRPPDRAAWDSVGPSRPGQATLVTAGLALAVPGLVLTAMRLVPPADDAAALVAAFIPFAVPLLALALLSLVAALVRARRRPPLAALTGVVGLLLGAQVAWQLPYFVPDHRPVPGATFAVLALNTYKGEADPEQVRAAAEQADVVVLSEVTLALVRTLEAQGWRDRFPYDAGAGGSHVTNTVVFSRFPLSGSERFGSGSFHQWATTVEVPDVGPVGVLAVHPCNPFCGDNRWADDHAALRRQVEGRLDRPLLVAGDLNAVVDHGPMQRLRQLGLRGGADLVGAGWAPTYPAGRLLPPLLTIDHVLVGPALGITTLDRVAVDGTDHLGLFARVGRSA